MEFKNISVLLQKELACMPKWQCRQNYLSAFSDRIAGKYRFIYTRSPVTLFYARYFSGNYSLKPPLIQRTDHFINRFLLLPYFVKPVVLKSGKWRAGDIPLQRIGQPEELANAGSYFTQRMFFNWGSSVYRQRYVKQRKNSLQNTVLNFLTDNRDKFYEGRHYTWRKGSNNKRINYNKGTQEGIALNFNQAVDARYTFSYNPGNFSVREVLFSHIKRIRIPNRQQAQYWQQTTKPVFMKDNQKLPGNTYSGKKHSAPAPFNAEEAQVNLWQRGNLIKTLGKERIGWINRNIAGALYVQNNKWYEGNNVNLVFIHKGSKVLQLRRAHGFRNRLWPFNKNAVKNQEERLDTPHWKESENAAISKHTNEGLWLAYLEKTKYKPDPYNRHTHFMQRFAGEHAGITGFQKKYISLRRFFRLFKEQGDLNIKIRQMQGNSFSNGLIVQLNKEKTNLERSFLYRPAPLSLKEDGKERETEKKNSFMHPQGKTVAAIFPFFMAQSQIWAEQVQNWRKTGNVKYSTDVVKQMFYQHQASGCFIPIVHFSRKNINRAKMVSDFHMQKIAEPGVSSLKENLQKTGWRLSRTWDLNFLGSKEAYKENRGIAATWFSTAIRHTGNTFQMPSGNEAFRKNDGFAANAFIEKKGFTADIRWEADREGAWMQVLTGGNTIPGKYANYPSNVPSKISRTVAWQKQAKAVQKIFINSFISKVGLTLWKQIAGKQEITKKITRFGQNQKKNFVFHKNRNIGLSQPIAQGAQHVRVLKLLPKENANGYSATALYYIQPGAPPPKQAGNETGGTAKGRAIEKTITQSSKQEYRSVNNEIHNIEKQIWNKKQHKMAHQFPASELNALAEKVYGLVERKVVNERNRYGL